MHKTGIAIEAAKEAAKVAPAAPVTIMSFLGYSVSDWASVATLIYVLALIGHFAWSKLIKPWRHTRNTRRMR